MTLTEQREQEAIALLKILPPESRDRVIGAIPTAFDVTADPEIARRIEAIDSGEVECIPHEEVVRRIRARIENA